MIFEYVGTVTQRALAQRAVDRCEFDFTKCQPSLLREGKDRVRVEWADLSRFAASDAKDAGGHNHVHDGDAVAHPIERVVNGRQRVLGLFYLPPHTKVVLDFSLEANPTLAQEVKIAEDGHLVDYHFMTPEMRRRFVNSIHTQQLPPGADVSDGALFQLDGHTCSWFDGAGVPYGRWCGEAFMEGFTEATTDIPASIQLEHKVGPAARAVVRDFLGIEAAPPAPEREEDPVDLISDELAKALERFLAGRSAPRYLRVAAEKWLSRKP